MSGDTDEAAVAKNEEWLDFMFQVTLVALEMNGVDISRCRLSLVLQYGHDDPATPEGYMAHVGQVAIERIASSAVKWVEEERNCEAAAQDALARIMEKKA